MTRKLFAFLALLSGLAALSSPAAASYDHANSTFNASVSASAETGVVSEQERAARPVNSVSGTSEGSSGKSRIPAPQSLRLPVLMGVERAYE